MPPFWKLCEEGDLKGVKPAIARGEDINGGNELNMIGLMLAVMGEHNMVVKELLNQSSVAINSSDFSGNTAVHEASDFGNVIALNMLVGNPRLTSVHTRGYLGQTPLMIAIRYGEIGCVRDLVRVEGADLETRDDQGKSLEEEAR